MLYIFSVFIAHERNFNLISDGVVSEKSLECVGGYGSVSFNADDDITDSDACCLGSAALCKI